MSVPKINRSQLDIHPIARGGLPKRYLHEGELEAIVALVRSVSPRNVLEFGVNEGRTARAILDNVPTVTKYQGIDVPPGYAFAKSVQAKEVPTEPGKYALGLPAFELILRPRGSFDLNSADLLPCDAAFIDGDHGREAVLNDTRLARQLVRPGGIIIWHDYHELGTVDVKPVLDELHALGAPLQHVDGTWLVFERAR